MKHLSILAALLAPVAALADPNPADWDAVLADAKGETVFWHAWGGSTTTNDFLAWVGSRVAEDYGVTLEHVKLTSTADAVTRVLAEKDAGEDDDGAVDMIWINGANFAAMKEADLLFGPYAEQLPNWAVVDGRFSYPQPPDFLGTTFLKQVLVDILPDASVLAAEAMMNLICRFHSARVLHQLPSPILNCPTPCGHSCWTRAQSATRHS